jgi:hypothetical protein
MVLEVMYLARKPFQTGERDGTDLAVLQGDGVAGVMFRADAVEPEQFPRHLEAGNLIATILEQDVGLEEAAAHCVDGIETLAGAIKMIPPLDPTPGGDQIVEPLHLVYGQPYREAKFPQVAVGAGSLQNRQQNFLNSGLWGHFQPVFA